MANPERVPCPACQAPAGTPCWDFTNGYHLVPHAVRSNRKRA